MATIEKTSRAQVYREIDETLGRVPHWVEEMPESALVGFWRLFRDFYLAETAIPPKYKELIGVAVSGATHCRYGTLFHTERARLHGATDREIAEASMMASVTMMGSTFLAGQQIDFAQFKRETHEIVAWARENAGKRVGREQHPRV